MLKFTPISGPTRRECVLLALLLLALLYFPKAGITVKESPTSRTVLEESVSKYDLKFEFASQDVHTPTADSERWRTRVTWTSELEVPSTSVVAHVPGAWPVSQPNVLLSTLTFKAGRYLTTCFC